MQPFQNSALWKSAFGGSKDKNHKQKKDELRQAFLSFRERAQQLANQIHTDHPTFSVHDITHIDALWETASLVVSESFPITPTEGFVLGGAILVHDLAMTVAAYPEGIAELKSEPEWSDTVVSLLQRKLGRMPSGAEIATPGSDIEAEATRILLRLFHAKQAEKLPAAGWTSGETIFHLIDSPNFRQTFGRSIGRIAASHWWPVSKLEKEFRNLCGAPGDCPNHWQVDELKLAALLRLADVCHLDERRAPSFLRAIRKPTGLADLHWNFQNKLLQPRIDGERLFFTSKTPFSSQESAAWWLCFDTLKDADRELRETTAMMSSLRPALNFRAKGIGHVESPERLSEVVRTENWLPVDAQVQVTDVASLARSLGGEQLYGDDKTVPLRELIQNASDAVRARRIFEGKDEQWGKICVRMAKEGDETWIEVEDTGIGMSKDVMRGPLLDFGKSYWASELMLREWPGLLAKGFAPIGKFGVGFYSVFMWGHRVRVTTQKLGDAKADTFTLEFGSGLEERPLLRPAKPSEFLEDSGTRVRVWLKKDLLNSKGLFPAERWRRHWKLDELCEWICPSLDVSLDVEQGGKTKRIIKASDWKTMDGYRFYQRLTPDERFSRYPKERVKQLRDDLKKLRVIKDESGNIVGRGCLLPYPWSERKEPEFGVVTTGGLRASSFGDYQATIFGVLAGKAISATRRTAVPTISPQALATWASEQARLMTRPLREEWGERMAAVIRSFGGDTGSLAIGFRMRRVVSIDDLKSWRKLPDEICLIPEDYDFQQQRKSTSLNPNVLAIEFNAEPPNLLRDRYYSGSEGWPMSEKVKLTPKRLVSKNTIYFAVLQALAGNWNSTVEEVIAASDFSQQEMFVGKRGKRRFKAKADVLRNPKIY